MKTDINGCSTCEAGREQYEFYNYHRPYGSRKTIRLVQYDYRHTDGELFSCVAPSLEEARKRRDTWLERHLS